jgi:CRP/FNR family transcriptional regulator, cyclic AMP receptor protein
MVQEAVAASFLSELPPATLQRLLRHAVLTDFPAGTTIYMEGESPRLGLVVDGLYRIYLETPAGRQVTFRYMRRGAMVGTVTMVGGPAPAYLQALTDGQVLLLNLEAVRALATTDARVAWLVAQDLSLALYDVLEELAASAFGTVRERIARHLLGLAAQQQHGPALVAAVRQQDLADATGSVREVVARVLRELRAEGLIRTSRQGIVILDPVGLHGQAWHRSR